MNLTKQKKTWVLRPKRNFVRVCFFIKFSEFWDPKGKLKIKNKKMCLLSPKQGGEGAGGNCGQLCIFGASIINLIKLFTKNPGEKWQLATQVNLAFFNFFFVFYIFIFSLVLFSSFVYTIYLLQVLVVAVLLLLLLCSLLLLLLLLLFFPLVVVVVVVDCSYFSFKS